MALAESRHIFFLFWVPSVSKAPETTEGQKTVLWLPNGPVNIQTWDIKERQWVVYKQEKPYLKTTWKTAEEAASLKNNES